MKDVLALGILAVHPPCEVQQELVKDLLEKPAIAFAAPLFLDLVYAPRGPRMYRGVHVAQCPFVRGQLTVGMHVPFAQHQHELFLGEDRVHQRQGDTVERKVPGGVPGVLPLVRHRDDVGVVQMPPFMIAALLPFARRRRHGGIAVEPFLDDIMIELLRPQETGK